MDKLMPFISRNNRTKEQKIRGAILLLEEQVRHAGRNNLPLKIFKFEELSLATKGFTTEFIYSNTYIYYGVHYYRAIIDGVQVLIKQRRWEEENWFFNGITFLSTIRHRNVIKLLGCCLDGPYTLVVFEFIPNGTLDHLIRSRVHRLPWPVRLRITTGIAEALAYLHHYGQRPIIHLDVKPENVFLDEDYNPKLSGFGLAILKPKDKEEADSTRLVGTLLYMDPEYFHTKVLTEKFDVYSFGVLLLVLLFWQLPSRRYKEGEEQLALTTIKSTLEILGLDLNKDDSFVEEVITHFPIAYAAEIILEEVGGRREQLSAFVELMFRCLNRRGEFRPTMREAVRELKRIQKMELKDRLLTQIPSRNSVFIQIPVLE